MERIEYVSRMEDYAAWVQLDMLYIRRWGRTQSWRLFRQCLLLDLFLLGILYLERAGWQDMAFCGGILVVIQIPLIWRPGNAVRRVSREEARRTFDDGKADGESRAIWFDEEKVVDEGANLQAIIRWQGIREMAVSSDWVTMNGGRTILYLRRQSVVMGDFDQFVAGAVEAFGAAKRQQGVNAKIIRLGQKICVDGVPISMGRKFLFGFLWGGAFLLLGIMVLGLLSIGAMVVLGFTQILDNDATPVLLSQIFTGILMFGSILSGIVGAVLGWMGVLPGARGKNR